MLAFSATLLASWEALAGGLAAGLLNGGPASLIYGMLLTMICGTALAASMGELASILPVAGAQYHWTYRFAPIAPRFFSFVQGWITIFAWIAFGTIGPFYIGTEIEGLVILFHPDYVAKKWHSTLLMWAIIIIPFIVNVWARRLLPAIEVIGGILHIIFLPVILVTVIVLGPRNPSSFVWATFVDNMSGWDNDGVIWSIGLLTAVGCVYGFDGVAHMGEEVKNAKKAVPQAMVYGVLINAVAGFGFLVGILYCMGNMEAALESKTGYPIMEIFYLATGSNAGTVVLTLLIMLPGFIASFNGMASVSRLLWSFARDNGLPFSKFFAHISPRYKIPMRCLYLTVAIQIILSLINIGSTTAFFALLSLSSLTFYISYLIPLVCLVWQRMRVPIEWGPWSLGKWGLPLNLISIAFIIYISIFLPFPAQMPVTAANMNYASLVFGAVVIFSVVDWSLRGRKKWSGPSLEMDAE
ncbi:hypothetical protein MPDQ_002327 [Monascus purpureus]|uniref:GABA-specific high-affinity permease n=1 Tax=Monascus purpureus TaxID=5098 RepID=A0A507QKN1_MONPU|nr:hypothetical protein MPDQ_002327 [Monascus purpureus]